MKKIICLSFFYVTVLATRAQNYVIEKCISGDCVNGNGVASVNNTDYGGKPGTYTGGFKNGKLSGEGKLVNQSKYFIGSFEDNFEKGYGSLFYTKDAGGTLIPDSSSYVDIGEWDGDGCCRVISVQSDNAKVYNGTGHGKKFHKKYMSNAPSLLADPWIGAHVKGLLASSARGYTPQFENMILAQKTFSTRKGVGILVAEWDCVTDRRYFVTASGIKKGVYTALPFGGYVNYQAIAEDGTVAYEGSADSYWTPKKPGRYQFLIVFDQAQSYGNGDVSVDVVTLACSLRSSRKTN